jgi:uncharacterized protein YbjT (DUF2867 family)
MKNVLLTGATGMIGAIILDACLKSDDVHQVTSLSRKSTGIEHPKLVEVLHSDFKDLSGLEKHFSNQDAAYYCIGVYTGQVPRDKFRDITVGYTIAFADMLKAHSPEVTFCFLSGQGADRSEKSQMMFAKDKGIAENYLMSKTFKALHIFRPAYIYPVEPRKEPNLSYRIFRFLYPILKNIMPKSSITSQQLGLAMFEAGLYGTELETLENEDIKKII